MTPLSKGFVLCMLGRALSAAASLQTHEFSMFSETCMVPHWSDRQSDPRGIARRFSLEGDTMFFVVVALGQRVSAKLDVLDTRIRAVIDLPPPVALFAETIRGKIRGIGIKLLG